MYLYIFINSISCLHLTTFRSKAAIVSEKSTVFTFSYKKKTHELQNLTLRKIGQGQYKVIFEQTTMGLSPNATYQVLWKSVHRFLRFFKTFFFTTYGLGGHLDHVANIILIIYMSLYKYLKAYTQYLVIIAQRFLRKASFNFHMLMILTLNTHKSLLTQLSASTSFHATGCKSFL